MSAEFPHLLAEYNELLRNNGSLERFFEIRSDIAYSLQKGDDRVFDKISIDDEVYINEHEIALPGLVEAVAATKRIDGVTSIIMDRLVPHVQAVILNGSANWGRNYSVKGNPKNRSDIDLDVIVDELTRQLALDSTEVEGDLRKFEGYYDQQAADMLISKLSINGVIVSLHFIPKKKALDVFELAFDTVTQPYSLRAYRRSLPRRPVQQYGPTYNFVHHPYYYDLEPRSLGDGYTSGQPFVMVGCNAEIVLAPSLHKLVYFGRIEGQMKSDIEKSCDAVVQRFVKRKTLDRERLNDELSFQKLIAKFSRMPRFIQDIVRSYDTL